MTPKLKWKINRERDWAFAQTGKVTLSICHYGTDEWMAGACMAQQDQVVDFLDSVALESVDIVDAMVECEAAVKERLMAEFGELLR